MRNSLKNDNRKITKRAIIAAAFAMIALTLLAASPRAQSPARVAVGANTSSATVRIMPENKTASALSITANRTTFLQVAPIAQLLNLEHTIDTVANRMIITTAAGRLTFAHDNMFYAIDTAAAVLSIAPIFRDNNFYLAAQDIITIFSRMYSGTISFDARTSTLTLTNASANTVASSATTSTASTTARTPTTAIAISSPPPTSPTPAPRTSIPQFDSIMTTIQTIVIDPGHGGRDPGAIGPGGTREKDVALAISLELQKQLEQAGLTVYMTRSTDVFIPLRDRTNFANEKRADLFVSIHANAIDGNQRRRDSVRGYKIYFLSQSKNEEDKLSAMRENAVIELEDRDTRPSGDMLQDMLNSIVGNEFLRESQELSIMMEQTFGARQNRIPRSQLGVGQANFWVLNGALMPAVLVEVGFISNTNEEKLLADPAVQLQLAQALGESIVMFKNMFEGQ